MAGKAHPIAVTILVKRYGYGWFRP
jgi:hypothetical protein